MFGEFEVTVGLTCIDIFDDDLLLVAGEVGTFVERSLHVGIHYLSQ